MPSLGVRMLWGGSGSVRVMGREGRGRVGIRGDEQDGGYLWGKILGEESVEVFCFEHGEWRRTKRGERRENAEGEEGR